MKTPYWEDTTMGPEGVGLKQVWLYLYSSDFFYLVPRSRYFTSVIRFGSRGHGPGQKSKIFTEPIYGLAEENSLSISGRGTAREEDFKLLDFGSMLNGQIKSPVWI